MINSSWKIFILSVVKFLTTWYTLIQLKYIIEKCFIPESLRKYPPLPFINRECVEDYKLPDTDITLEKGTGLLIPITSFHYDEEIFENPMEFDPERFSHENKQKRHQYAHIPFGEGPRICIGLYRHLLH